MFYILARLSVDVMYSLLFFFNDTATTEIYTLSLHDALPIYRIDPHRRDHGGGAAADAAGLEAAQSRSRSEEHTSELQSPCNLVCRLLLEKKKKHRLMIWALGIRGGGLGA